MWSSDLFMHIATTKVSSEVMVRIHLKDVHNRKLKGNCKPVCKSKHKRICCLGIY